MTDPQAIAAYDGMTLLDLIRVSKDAYFDPDTGRGEISKVKEVKPDLDAECILLRDRVNDQRILVPHDNEKTTNEMRENLITINKCSARQWPDIRITKKNYIELREKLLLNKNK